MIEILHTHDAAQADLMRAALEAEGIRVHALRDAATADPFVGRHVLAVREVDAERAIAIRRRIEHKAAASRPKQPFLRPLPVIVVLAFWVAVYFVLRRVLR
ncbi:MAG TPA: hypothetical protein VFT41_04850 [Gemmatimonadaceae bacterium]|nr:hypothetical protein [Gemmatimonadaceae bacterium]